MEVQKTGLRDPLPLKLEVLYSIQRGGSFIGVIMIIGIVGSLGPKLSRVNEVKSGYDNTTGRKSLDDHPHLPYLEKQFKTVAYN
ncbi:hypothetical protein NQ318_018333 [Aromia moschata]|uniref:Uncharacterized protein n=1 Tax=Aromia moschata TaxID=1265417 RepID=A0AAV8ZEE2_9CUCU|nr:hypothetical protein NQ318_018333 [Aromia moschata]